MDLVTYWTLEIQGVAAPIEDLVTHHLFAAGATGVQENLEFTQGDRQYQPSVVETEVKTLLAYFLDPPHPDFMESLHKQFPDVQFCIEQHESQDWLACWKQQWKPFELVEGVWIVPEWHRADFTDQPVGAIFIEPGMAFGTGTHATTQIAAELMQRLFAHHKIQSLLDVGTGSGILAFLGALHNLANIYAYDNDRESKRVFHENLAKNPSPSVVVWQENWPVKLQGKLDLTVSNIIDGVLLDLKPLFQQVKSPFYIFTGILAQRESLFLEEMTRDWQLIPWQRLAKDEWVGFLFKRSE